MAKHEPHKPDARDIQDARATADHQLRTGRLSKVQHAAIHAHLDKLAKRLGKTEGQGLFDP